jgi:NifB/MoaA-like Fe-S oxidoreductase
LTEIKSTQFSPSGESQKYTIITGALTEKYIKNLSDTISKKYGKINVSVFAVRNHFFGESVTVSGLITGNDIIAQLKGKELGSKLLIPQNMLRHGEEVFLDDVTVSELSETLGVPVRIVKQDGADLLQALLGK